MSEQSQTKRIKIDPDFFCDGAGYLLTSASLGGSDLTPTEISETLFEAKRENCLPLVQKGICIPLGFDGDCALDQNTVFVLGDLSEQEQHDWIARLVWKLKVPCGKLILCCGWCDDELIPAVAGEKPPANDVRYQVIDIPPDEYLVEVYAYLSSLTVELSLNVVNELGHYEEDEELAAFYEKNYPGIEGIDYIIRLTPLGTEPKMPKMTGGWFEDFEFRAV